MRDSPRIKRAGGEALSLRPVGPVHIGPRGPGSCKPMGQAGAEVMTMFLIGFDWSAGLVAAALWVFGVVAIGVLAYFASGGRSRTDPGRREARREG